MKTRNEVLMIVNKYLLLDAETNKVVSTKEIINKMIDELTENLIKELNTADFKKQSYCPNCGERLI
jgi:hypothetical protein